ncbi:UvrD-helicase domain-containing protein [Zavarzinella formosa]|uniref:UvrD-helicase domain-containing protein n=1 Tax=Zavarzinella formosa TaxID=360055 RepID=UPI000360B1D3|nr:UvrD-helicase domain-containing protein [Zavarzinella formosa]
MSSSKPVPPTSQQAAALEAAGSVVLSSGAGCGKTFVLTRRFLGYLADHSVGEIVAITFTERAARDMRGRIRRAVREKMTEEPTAKWNEHLRELESATITTIHSFCGNLVRQHAIVLGIDPQFEILEEMLSVNLMDDAIRKSMQDLVIADDSVGEDCRRLVVIYGWSEVLRCVAGLINQRDFPAWETWVSRSATDIAAEWGEVHRELLASSVREFFASHPAWKRAEALIRDTPCKHEKIRERFLLLLEKSAGIGHSVTVDNDIAVIRESAMIHREKEKAWGSPEVYQMMLEALKEFREALDEAFRKLIFKQDNIPKIAEVAQRFVRAALRVGRDFQETKRRAGVLDFDDLLALALRLLSEHPEILKRVRERYRRLLLDEMQDTDQVQMDVIRLLTGDPRMESRLFAVGDVKQSIYRFRGAEVALFGQLRQSVPESNRLPLSANFRSQPAILTFVNALFSPVFPDYEPLTTTSKQIHDEPCVEFWWSIHGEEGAKADELRELEAKTVARRIRQMLQDQRPMVRQKKDGTLRPMKLGDVVLLFRSMSNVPVYESALRDEGLDYYIVGGRAFFAQQEVYDILNLLKSLENPDDAISLIGVLRSPLGGLSDETLLVLGQHSAGLWEAMFAAEALQELSSEQRQRTQRIAGWLATWRSLKDRVPMTALLNRVMSDAGYDAALQFETLGDRKLANLWKLIEMARNFDRTGLFHLSDFIRQLSAMVSRELREEQAATQPENADVIRLMSVHQSKGLEFPVVILPDIAARKNAGLKGKVRWDRRLGCVVKPPDEKPLLFGEFVHQLASVRENMAEFEEEQRVFYVAATRAEDLLVLSGSFAEPFPTDTPDDQPLSIKVQNPWIETLNERFHLRTGECFDRSLGLENSPRVSVRQETLTMEPPKTRRAKPVEAPLIDHRSPARNQPRYQRAIFVEEAISDESTIDREQMVEVLANLREPATAAESTAQKGLVGVPDLHPAPFVFRHQMSSHQIQIRGITDGMIGETVLVIDRLERGLIRLGMAAKAMENATYGKGIGPLCLLNLETGALEPVTTANAKSAAGKWLKSLSLEINTDAE